MKERKTVFGTVVTNQCCSPGRQNVNKIIRLDLRLPVITVELWDFDLKIVKVNYGQLPILLRSMVELLGHY